MSDGRVHFWTPHPIRLDEWHPDRQPERYADGCGHSNLELFVRLRERGRDVTIGPTMAPSAVVVVVCLRELSRWSGEPNLTALARIGRVAVQGVPLIAIRNDVRPEVRAARFIHTEVHPTRASAAGGLFVPLLPQRGLRPRLAERRGSIRTLAIKCYRDNVPGFVRTGVLQGALADLGVELRVHTEPRYWPLFDDVDSALCWPGDADVPMVGELVRKPATKLINAWHAGAVPLVARMPSYLELGTPERDMIVVDDVAGIVAAVRRLCETPDLVARLEQGVRAAASTWSMDALLDAWWEALHVPASKASAVDVLTGCGDAILRKAWHVWRRRDADA